MKTGDIEAQIIKALREIDECERLIKAGDADSALHALAQAEARLRKIVDRAP